jgi:hypothetical protein
MVGDTREHEAEIRLGIDIVKLRHADETVNRGGAFATRVSAGEQANALPPSWAGYPQPNFTDTTDMSI